MGRIGGRHFTMPPVLKVFAPSQKEELGKVTKDTVFFISGL